MSMGSRSSSRKNTPPAAAAAAAAVVAPNADFDQKLIDAVDAAERRKKLQDALTEARTKNKRPLPKVVVYPCIGCGVNRKSPPVKCIECATEYCRLCTLKSGVCKVCDAAKPAKVPEKKRGNPNKCRLCPEKHTRVCCECMTKVCAKCAPCVICRRSECGGCESNTLTPFRCDSCICGDATPRRVKQRLDEQNAASGATGAAAAVASGATGGGGGSGVSDPNKCQLCQALNTRVCYRCVKPTASRKKQKPDSPVAVATAAGGGGGGGASGGGGGGKAGRVPMYPNRRMCASCCGTRMLYECSMPSCRKGVCHQCIARRHVACHTPKEPPPLNKQKPDSPVAAATAAAAATAPVDEKKPESRRIQVECAWCGKFTGHSKQCTECNLEVCPKCIDKDGVCLKCFIVSDEYDDDSEDEDEDEYEDDAADSNRAAAVTAAAAAAAAQPSVPIPDDKACIACVTLPFDTLFMPCGHIMFCGVCAAKVDACPTCRVVIEKRVKAYFSV